MHIHIVGPDGKSTLADLSGVRNHGPGVGVAIGAASAQSAAISAPKGEVLVVASVKCYIRDGENPTAQAPGTGYNSIPMEAGEKFYLRITDGHKIAVIQDSAPGHLHITPVA